jgi:hypothetical protein
MPATKSRRKETHKAKRDWEIKSEKHTKGEKRVI